MTHHKLTVERYARRRRILIAAMGGCCIQCGEQDSSKLEFHHTEPQEWVAASTSRWQRQLKYEEDWDAGVLELLCRACNKAAGVPVGTDFDVDDTPF